MTYTDCMVDIETLSTTPDSVITQIAWVFLNRNDRSVEFIKQSFDVNVPQQIISGRDVSESTWFFWMGLDGKKIPSNVEKGSVAHIAYNRGVSAMEAAKLLEVNA